MFSRDRRALKNSDIIREKLEGHFPSHNYLFQKGNHSIELPLEDLEGSLKALHDGLDFIFLVDITGVDNVERSHQEGKRFHLVFTF